jgi:hypothetical protein
MEERMRLSHLFSVAATVLLLPGVGVAEEPVDPTNTPDAETAQAAAAANPSAEGDDLNWERFDDPEFAPNEGESGVADALQAEGTTESVASIAEPDGSGTAEVESAPATASGVILGPVGVDDQGRTGRLHTVATGDTLWDLSAAYLGTPWVWPSVWIDNNDDIANPHLIIPGDKIWITANEMRVVSDAEAESFLVPVVAETPAAAAMEAPVAEGMDEMAGGSIPPLAALEDDPSTLDAFPVAIPGQEPGGMDGNRQITVASREMMGFVTAETLAGASSIVGSTSERTFLSTGDPVFLGIGEGDAEVGDQFTVFQALEEVRDVETNRLLGHHVENLGWLEVEELTGDTSIGSIRQSYDVIPRGAQVVPRERVSRHVEVRITPDAIEGQIVFLPYSQTLMADGGYVYLNRGEFHGIEIGSELEVFDGGRIVSEEERRVDVRTPDSKVATLVVVTVEPESSVAFVLSAARELAAGDHVRPAVSRLAGH